MMSERGWWSWPGRWTDGPRGRICPGRWTVMDRERGVGPGNGLTGRERPWAYVWPARPGMVYSTACTCGDPLSRMAIMSELIRSLEQENTREASEAVPVDELRPGDTV